MSLSSSALAHSTFSRRRFLAGLGILAAAGTVAACSGDAPRAGDSSSATSAAPRQGGTLTIGMPQVSAYLNPLVATSATIGWASEPVVESLYTYGPDMQSLPLLAAGEPEISPDGLTWTVKLKEGVTFSNGDAFTAEHVAATISHVSNPEAFSDWTNFFAKRVTEATAEDDHTLVLRLPAPFGILRTFLTNLPIVHKDYLEQTDTTVGTGPFVIEESVQSQKLVLTRNPEYHGEAPLLESIVFQAVPDAATRLVNLREGTIQVMTDVPPDNVALLEGEEGITVHTVDAPVSLLTYFNATREPFDDVRVRQALAHAMDRDGINELVFAGTAPPSLGSPSGPSMEGYDPDLKLYEATPNVQTAKGLLAEAGVTNPTFTLMVSSSNAQIAAMAQVLQEGWKEAGIDCTLESVEAATWIARWMEGDYDMALNIFSTGISVGRSAYLLLSPYSSFNPLNYGYQSDEVDELMDKAWATISEEERDDYSRQVGEILARDAVCVPPVYPQLIVAQRTSVTPLDADALSVGRIRAKTAGLVG